MANIDSLTPDMVAAIRALYDEGVSTAEICARFAIGRKRFDALRKACGWPMRGKNARGKNARGKNAPAKNAPGKNARVTHARVTHARGRNLRITHARHQPRRARMTPRFSPDMMIARLKTCWAQLIARIAIELKNPETTGVEANFRLLTALRRAFVELERLEQLDAPDARGATETRH